MKKILITQRFEKIGTFKEPRDNLDVRLTSLIFKLGYIPVLVPTNSIKVLKYIKQISPNGIILSGGGDPKKVDERYILEKKLLNYTHHDEFAKSKLKIEDLRKKIKERKVIYDHSVDQTQNKWDSDVTLSKVKLSDMPDYLKENYKKYINWLEI